MSLVDQISAMYDADQFARLAGKDLGPLDETHGLRIRAIKQDLGGWPDDRHLDAEGLRKFALLVVHQTLQPEMQKDFAPHLKGLCKRQLVPWQYYAVIKDKIRIAAHRPQIYGTQLNDSPVQRLETVDKRRTLFGLQTLEAYRARNL
ncbi:MAG: hypothetical protein EYC62_03755 [Alphaproteobacteria bacterium]|nr:MAG: hypothetical protein EYC62_03755 [Alphaproteobacteria bacterium]